MRTSEKKVLISGVTGQDGPYLCKHLLDEGYEVYGMIRRASTPHFQGLKYLGILDDITIVECELTEYEDVRHTIEHIMPDEVYNLAAQSHVGSSFNQPVYTSNVNYLGVLHILEAFRGLNMIKEVKFYQASTSEMFGGVSPPEKGYDEESIFHPRSPYGVSKLGAHWLVQNYREAYGLFGCCGILFNHECFSSRTPLITCSNGEIDVVYISDLIRNRTSTSNDESSLTKILTGSGLQVWDGSSFVSISAISRTKIRNLDPQNQTMEICGGSGGSVETTPNHNFITSNGGRTQARTTEGKDLLLGTRPRLPQLKECSQNFASLLGLLAGDGYVSDRVVRLINTDQDILDNFENLCRKLFTKPSFLRSDYESGFGGRTISSTVTGLGKHQCLWIRNLLYHKRTKHKKVPALIFNGPKESKLAFLQGYNLADGLKAGNERYEFASFKTNSPLLAQGILLLISETTKQTFNVNQFVQNEKTYWQINLHSPDKSGAKGDHLKRNPACGRKPLPTKIDDKNFHVFNIETTSGKVMAGIGNLIVSNSPLRGMNFVTRKVTHGLARLALGKTKIPLEIGNILATRDWGHAEDYTRAMYLMLQQDKPDNYVVATGEASSVAHLVNVAAYYCGIQGKWEGDGVDAQYIDEHGVLVKINPEFYRPAEVSSLIGNYSRAKRILQWEPEYCFEDTIRDMVHHDMNLLHSEVGNNTMRVTLNDGQATMAELIKKVNNGKIQDTLEA